jgi:hypothetical protein
MIMQETKGQKFTVMIFNMKGIVTNCKTAVKVKIQLIDLVMKFKSLV